jgi:hypothetical protein
MCNLAAGFSALPTGSTPDIQLRMFVELIKPFKGKLSLLLLASVFKSDTRKDFVFLRSMPCMGTSMMLNLKNECTNRIFHLQKKIATHQCSSL